MIKVYIRALEFAIPVDGDGNTVIRPALGVYEFEADDTHISTFSINHNDRKAQNRTIENRLVTDLVANYKTIKIGYQVLDVNIFAEIKKFYDAQCEQQYCLEVHYHNSCGGCDTSCCACNNSCGWDPVYMTFNTLNFIDCGTYVEGFEITLEEYSKDCAVV
jgi:hypothetical protein